MKLYTDGSIVGWISTIRVLGDIFNLQGFFVWHLTMVIIMCIIWAVLIVLTTWAFWRGDIFLAKEEDILKDTVVGEETEKDTVSQCEHSEHGHHTPEPSYPQPLRPAFHYV